MNMEEKKPSKEQLMEMKEKLEKVKENINDTLTNSSPKADTLGKTNVLKRTLTPSEKKLYRWGYANTVLLGLVFVVSMFITTTIVVFNVLNK